MSTSASCCGATSSCSHRPRGCSGATAGSKWIDRRIGFGAFNMIARSPVTEKHVGGNGMTLGELRAATITTRDNAAANPILASDGGPRAFAAFARDLGDPVTRLDHTEPALNAWRDAVSNTTSPCAMLASLQRVALGDALSPASRDTLQRWPRVNPTGKTRLEAGLPAGWVIGNTIGSSDNDGHGAATNDIAVVWPPRPASLRGTRFLTRSRAGRASPRPTRARGALTCLCGSDRRKLIR